MRLMSPSCRRFLAAASLILLAHASLRAENSSQVRSQFSNPPRQYSTVPFWVWNDLLTEEQIRTTLRDLAEHGIKAAIVHPRFGLMTPYLSDEWFRLWEISLDEASKLDMDIWIYDENSYPSGFAGGWIPEMMPEARGQGLSVREDPKPQQDHADILGVYRVTEQGVDNLTATLRTRAADLPDGKYLVAHREWTPPQSYFAYRTYVDILRPGVTERFLDVTLEPYRRRFSDLFGKRIPGVFTDEAGYRSAGEMPWSEGLPAAFEKRFGYSLLDHLPSLRHSVGDWKKIRHDFCQILLEQFIEHWSRPYCEYCEKNHLEFTGHYFEHDWPDVMGVPDNLSIYPYQQRPAIDALFNTYLENTHHHFGNLRLVKELSSAANQCGRKRTLCEAYGAGGWDLRFEDMKRNGDWLYAGGVNTLNQHLSFISIRGARKQDNPQSFSRHAPWWDSYRVMADYFSRLSLTLSSGEEINRILVIQPTSTAWMYQSAAHSQPRLTEVGDRFFDFILGLAKSQVEYDLGSEHSLAREGRVDGNQLILGKRKYPVVVLPPNCETLRNEVVDLLDQHLAGGGRVLCADAPPSLIDARPSDRWDAIARKPGWKTLPAAEIRSLLTDNCPEAQVVPRITQTQGLVFHLRKQLDDGQFLFVVNSSLTEKASFTLDLAGGSLTQWDSLDGSVHPLTSGQGRKTFELFPAGSLLLFFSPQPSPAAEPDSAVASVTKTIQPLGPPTVKRQELNVLTLDFVDVTVGGETKKNTYFYEANRFVFMKNGMPHGNPWDTTIQYKDEYLKHRFPADSGFEAVYRFTLEQQVPAALEIVIERPDLYEITCNGQPVLATKDVWWLDESFGRIDLSTTAKVGPNAVVLRAKPMTIYHELEAAYLRGEFNLRPADSGFVVIPPRSMDLSGSGDIHGQNPENTMWLTCGIGVWKDAAGKPLADGAPFVVFDLGTPTRLSAVRIWNYNEINLKNRGAKAVRLSGSSTDGQAASFATPLGDFELQPSNGTAQAVETRSSDAVRFVRLDVLSNHNGVSFPTRDVGKDNAYTGLSEVQFITAIDGKPQVVPDVKITAFSSEFTVGSLNRRAQFLVDRSGLTPGCGWNAQGHPFYSAGVSYREEFSLPEVKGLYDVRLPHWFGSVATVKVNGRSAGCIFQQPYRCDVTRFLKPGRNDIEVVVVGTLKNLLGAHHGGPVRGTVGPFSVGPASGPPPGDQYDTIGYGLFEPFVLEQQ